MDAIKLDVLPTLSDFIRERRSDLNAKLARIRARARLYLQFLRKLRRHGVALEYSTYGAEQGEVTVELFEKVDGRIQFTLDWSRNGGRLRPVLKRTAQGTPVVAVLGKLAGFRLSKAGYRYPGKTDTPDVYRCTGSVELGGKWQGLTVEFPALFHDKEGQHCRIEKTLHGTQPYETMCIVCKA